MQRYLTNTKFVKRLRYFSQRKVISYWIFYFLRLANLSFFTPTIWKFTFFRIEEKRIRAKLSALQENLDSSFSSKTPSKIRTGTVALLIPQYLKRSGVTMESDMHFTFYHSLIEFGIQPYRDVAVRNPSEILDYLKFLNSDTTKLLPAVIVLDANHFTDPEIRTVLEKEIFPLRRKGVSLLIEVPDCYVTRDGLTDLQYWIINADVVVCHNSRVRQFVDSDKLIIWPGFPLPMTCFPAYKPHQYMRLLIQGSSHRQRNLFASKAKKAGLPVDLKIHSRSMGESTIFGYQEYIKSLGKYWFTFSNGYVNKKESIIVGRALETLAHGNVLLYESKSDLGFFFKEYSEYIPIKNYSDLILKANFLIQNFDFAVAISRNARNAVLSRYTGNHFWEIVFDRIAK